MAGGSCVNFFFSLIFICATLLIQLFFTNTVQRFLLLKTLTQTKDLGQLSSVHIAAGKIGGGYIDIQTAIAFSQLTLKYRRNKNLFQRVIVFVASLLERMVRIAKTEED